MNVNNHMLRPRKWLVGIYLAQEVQSTIETQCHVEASDANAVEMMLSTAQVNPEVAEKRQLLEEVCLEGAKMSSEKCEQLATVLEAHTKAFSRHEIDYGFTTTLDPFGIGTRIFPGSVSRGQDNVKKKSQPQFF